MNRKLQRTIRSALLTLIAVFFAVLFFTPTVGNLWGIATERAFIIPKESSIFTFQVTEMNSGSGDWWLYGEDRHHFYAQGDRDGLIYIAFPKPMVARCPSFRPRDWTTWCKEFQLLHEST